MCAAGGHMCQRAQPPSTRCGSGPTHMVTFSLIVLFVGAHTCVDKNVLPGHGPWHIAEDEAGILLSTHHILLSTQHHGSTFQQLLKGLKNMMANSPVLVKREQTLTNFFRPPKVVHNNYQHSLHGPQPSPFPRAPGFTPCPI